MQGSPRIIPHPHNPPIENLGDMVLRLAATPGSHAALRGKTGSDQVEVTVQKVQQLLMVPSDIDAVILTPSDPAATWVARYLGLRGVTTWWLSDQHLTGAGPRSLSGLRVDLERLAQTCGRAGAASLGAGPPVSVIATVLNEGAEVVSMAEAVLAQLSPQDEFVIVDGGSTDGSLEHLPADPRLRVIVAEGVGISQGRNVATREARHNVMVCVDAGCPLDKGALDGARQAFAGTVLPGLVSGVYRPSTRNGLESAQAAACYPDREQVLRPDLLTRLYTRIFGTGYNPRFAVGRCMAYTREAWEAVGGFPEHLATGEDVTFGLAISRKFPVWTAADFAVEWFQRESLRKTWRMYRNYGLSSSQGDRALLLRDGARAAGYVVGTAMALNPRTRVLAGVGAVSYLSLPVVRYLRGGAPRDGLPLIPLAMATKDIGKVSGAALGIWRSRSAE